MKQLSIRLLSALLACALLFSLQTPLTAAAAERNGETIKTLYTLPSNDALIEAGIFKGTSHDRQDLGIWMKAGTSITVRQVNTSYNSSMRLWLLCDDSANESSVIVPANGGSVTITAKVNCVPFLDTPTGDGIATYDVAFSAPGGAALPIYKKGDNEAAFFSQWSASGAPYAMLECHSTIFLVPVQNMHDNQFSSLDAMLQYYDDMLAQYDRFAGLTDDRTADPWNVNNGSRYFVKADAHGAGSAYYGGNWTASNSTSISGYMKPDWLSMHEFGHGYGNGLDGNSDVNNGEVWNNIYAHYYQSVTPNSGTWLDLSEQARANYDSARQQSGYNSASFAPRLYFYINMLDKLGPEKAMSYLNSTYRKTIHNKETLPAVNASLFDYYFTTGSGYNVTAYYELWSLPISDKIRSQLITNGSYETVYPLRNLTQTDAQAQSIAKTLGLTSPYSLVGTEQLRRNTDLTGTVNIQLDDASLAQVQGKYAELSDGLHTVARVQLTGKTTAVTLPIGVYNVLMPSADDGSYIATNQYDYAVVTANGTAAHPVTYKNQASSLFVSDYVINFLGLGDETYFTATYDLGAGTMNLNTHAGAPHSYFSTTYSSIKVSKPDGTQTYYKEHVGNTSSPSDDTISIAVGDIIEIYHREPTRMRIVSGLTSLGQNNFYTTIATTRYRITDKGLQRIYPESSIMVGSTVDDNYYKRLCAFMDALLEKASDADLYDPASYSYEKAVITSGASLLTSAQLTNFLNKYSGYYPFGTGHGDLSYMVLFNQNGSATGVMISQFMNCGETEALDKNLFTWKNHTFLGWSLDPYGKTAMFADEEAVKNLTTSPGKSVNLYAIWTTATTLHFDANGGSGTMADYFVAHDGTATLPTNTFTRQNFKFTGWGLQPGDSGVSYTDGQSNFPLPGGEVTLYAQWESSLPDSGSYQILKAGQTAVVGSATYRAGDTDLVLWYGSADQKTISVYDLDSFDPASGTGTPGALADYRVGNGGGSHTLTCKSIASSTINGAETKVITMHVAGKTYSAIDIAYGGDYTFQITEDGVVHVLSGGSYNGGISSNIGYLTIGSDISYVLSDPSALCLLRRGKGTDTVDGRTYTNTSGSSQDTLFVYKDADMTKANTVSGTWSTSGVDGEYTVAGDASLTLGNGLTLAGPVFRVTVQDGKITGGFFPNNSLSGSVAPSYQMLENDDSLPDEASKTDYPYAIANVLSPQLDATGTMLTGLVPETIYEINREVPLFTDKDGHLLLPEAYQNTTIQLHDFGNSYNRVWSRDFSVDTAPISFAITPTAGKDCLVLRGSWTGEGTAVPEVKLSDGTTISGDTLTWSIVPDSATRYGFPTDCVTVAADGVLSVRSSGICDLQADYNGTSVTIPVVVPGDYNRDGKVNTADATSLIDVILEDVEMKSTAYSKELLDLTGDGNLNTADATILIDIAVGDRALEA